MATGLKTHILSFTLKLYKTLTKTLSQLNLLTTMLQIRFNQYYEHRTKFKNYLFRKTMKFMPKLV